MPESAEEEPLPEEPEDEPEPEEPLPEEDPELPLPDEPEPEFDEDPAFSELLPEDDDPPFEEPEEPEAPEPEPPLAELEESDESTPDAPFDWEEASFAFVDDDSLAASPFAAPLLAEEPCFAWDASLAVKIGSVFSPMPWPSVNTWISLAEITMAIKAETMETMITLR